MLFFGKSPGLLEILVALVPQLFLLDGIQITALDAQTTAHGIEQQAQCPFPSLGADIRQRPEWEGGPYLLVLAQFRQVFVGDLQQTQLLQVRIVVSPTPAKIEIEPVSQYGPHGLFRPPAARPSGIRILKILLACLVEAQLLEYALGDHAVGQIPFGC